MTVLQGNTIIRIDRLACFVRPAGFDCSAALLTRVCGAEVVFTSRDFGNDGLVNSKNCIFNLCESTTQRLKLIHVKEDDVPEIMVVIR